MYGLKDLFVINIYGNLIVYWVGVVVFNIGGILFYDLVRVLSYEYVIEIWVGCFCVGFYGYDLLNFNV